MATNCEQKAIRIGGINGTIDRTLSDTQFPDTSNDTYLWTKLTFCAKTTGVSHLDFAFKKPNKSTVYDIRKICKN